MGAPRRARAALMALLGVSLAACTDLSSYSTTAGKQYAGCVVAADFVLAGVSPTTELCMTLDGSHLQTTPGTISSTDGRFAATPLRPIPQIWNDPLSTLNFGQGRTKNLIYMATPAADGGGGPDITVVVSLMEGGGAEIRLVRGAPGGGESGDAAPSSSPVFAVVPMRLEPNGCAELSATHCTPDAAPP